MSWFEKCSMNTIDGRLVIICSKKPEYIKRYTPDILKICASRKMAKFFPILYFSLEEAPIEKISPAYVFVEEVAAGMPKIYLIPSKITDFNYLDHCISHELTHLLHNYLSGWARKQVKTATLLQEATEKLLYDELCQPELPKLRKLLSLFVLELYSEGIARLGESYAEGGIVFSEDNFIKLYAEGQQAALGLNKQLLELFNETNKQEVKQKLAAYFRGPQYSIGLHMAFSLLFLHQERNLTKIAKMNHFTFIKRYEACMEKRGLKPVVSLTSGAGYFDYKRSLQQWWKAVKG